MSVVLQRSSENITGLTHVRVCKRENNSKRSHVLVNMHQGKHYPVAPSIIYNEVHEMYERSKSKLDSSYKNKLVVGFAETATALGALYAACLVRDGYNVVYLPTSREPLDGKKIPFTEDHSHAVDQYMMEISPKGRTYELIFVEDEVSTGNTLMHIVDKIRGLIGTSDVVGSILEEGKIAPRIVCVSLISAMNTSQRNDLRNKNISYYGVSLSNTTIFGEQANNVCTETEKYTCDLRENSDFTLDYLSKNDKINNMRLIVVDNDTERFNIRFGRKAVDYMKHCHAFACRVYSTLSQSKPVLFDEMRKAIVIGTEECMYPAIVLARMLEDSGISTTTHSTTRSPIEVSHDKLYPITDRVILSSVYDRNRKTFLYNTLAEKDCAVFIVTDTEDVQHNTGIAELVQYYQSKNCETIVCRL